MSRSLCLAIFTVVVHGAAVALFLALPADSELRSERRTMFWILVLPAAGAGGAIVLADRDLRAKKDAKQAKCARVIGGVVLVIVVLFYLGARALEWLNGVYPDFLRMH